MHSHLAFSHSPKHQAKRDKKKEKERKTEKKKQYESCAILCEYVHKKNGISMYFVG